MNGILAKLVERLIIPRLVACFAYRKVEANLPSLKKLATDLYLHTVLTEDGPGELATTESLLLTKYSKPVKYFKLVSDDNTVGNIFLLINEVDLMM